MKDKQGFKVIIVGGSIAGLSLANMLERLNIDFVVLEAYNEIAPQVAGNALQALVDTPSNTGFYRNQQGETLFKIHGMADVLERRHGYPVIFIQRQMLVQALYDNLRCKNKVLVQKRLVNIELQDDGVQAITKDGTTYVGDIIIGADGMHSSVRKQMHILGHTCSPGYFDQDEYSKVPCTYKCIFGIARAPRGIEKGSTHIVMGKNYSHSIMTGPGGRVFFFLNVKENKTTYGKAVQRYSAEDERAVAEDHFQDRLNEHDTFQDVYKEKIISRLTPLHEYQWKRWYFKRIMAIGDASHKMHPISGNGGAAAVEDAAALVNALQRKLEHVKTPSTKDFQEVFAETQHIREKRTRGLLEQSTKMQQLDAMESPFSSLAVRYVLPNLTSEAFFSPVSANAVQGPHCEFLPTPHRDRYVPYQDDLSVGSLGYARVGTMSFVILYSLFFCLSWLPWNESALWTIPINFGQWGHHLNPTTTEPLQYSRESMDDCLSLVITLLPITFIWNIEASRLGNVQSLGSRPVTFLIIAAFYALSPEKVVPIYMGIAFYNSRRIPYCLTSGRPVPLPVVKAANVVVWAVFATLAVSSCLSGYVLIGIDRSSSLWCILPFCISGLIHLLAITPIFKEQPRGDSSNDVPEKQYMKPYLNQDYLPLTTLYKTLIVLSFLSSLIISPASLDSHSLVSATLITHCLQMVFDMRRLGYITNIKAIYAASIMILGTSAIASVPVYIASYYWRESVIHRLSK